jgi:hypothetical protein
METANEEKFGGSEEMKATWVRNCIASTFVAAPEEEEEEQQQNPENAQEEEEEQQTL